jgi:hypothetical protein
LPTPPRLKAGTAIVDQHDNQLATIDGMLWPRISAVIGNHGLVDREAGRADQH